MSRKARRATRNNHSTTNADVEQDSGNAPLRANEAQRVSAPCRITFTHARARLADMDNLSIKAILDGLVQAGVFATDTPEQVAEIRHRQVKSKTETTTIVIEPFTKNGEES